MKYEKPQEKNPHRLTICQHTFPVASIVRFSGNNGSVELFLIAQNKQLRLKPSDQLFCAKRVWDQSAETGFMKEIEDKYQELANSVIYGRVKSLSKCMQEIITDMFALWNIREFRKENPIDDQAISNIIDIAPKFTKNEQEVLEKNYIATIRPTLIIPGRHLSSGAIQLNIFEVRQQMKDAHWGILNATRGQFIVPDNFSNATVLPLTPSLCFFSQSDNDAINEDEVAKINQLAIASSRHYYFAKELSKCPV